MQIVFAILLDIINNFSLVLTLYFTWMCNYFNLRFITKAHRIDYISKKETYLVLRSIFRYNFNTSVRAYYLGKLIIWGMQICLLSKGNALRCYAQKLFICCLPYKLTHI